MCDVSVPRSRLVCHYNSYFRQFVAPQILPSFLKHRTMAAAGEPPLKQTILNAVATLAGRTNCATVQRWKVLELLGIDRETRAYGDALGVLKNRDGYIEVQPYTIKITPTGKANAAAEEPLGSNLELLEEAKKNVSLDGKAILNLLADGRTSYLIEVGDAIGSDRACFGDILTPLVKLGYVEYVIGIHGAMTLRMTDRMFIINGRPGANDDAAEEDDDDDDDSDDADDDEDDDDDDDNGEEAGADEAVGDNAGDNASGGAAEQNGDDEEPVAQV